MKKTIQLSNLYFLRNYALFFFLFFIGSKGTLNDQCTLSKVSTTSTSNGGPQMSGNIIVWSGSDGNNTSQVYKSENGAAPVLVSTDNGPQLSGSCPQISGNTIVWMGSGGANQ